MSLAADVGCPAVASIADVAAVVGHEIPGLSVGLAVFDGRIVHGKN